MDIQFDNQAVIVTVVERGARVWASMCWRVSSQR